MKAMGLAAAQEELLMLNRDYTQNPTKIYDFGNCKATATANRRRK
jgi:hypothetical protein